MDFVGELVSTAAGPSELSPWNSREVSEHGGDSTHVPSE